MSGVTEMHARCELNIASIGLWDQLRVFDLIFRKVIGQICFLLSGATRMCGQIAWIIFKKK